MELVFSRQSYNGRGKIFLAGPTPRDSNVKSWRAEAVAWLELFHFKGTVLIPEEPKFAPCPKMDKETKEAQYVWERAGLVNADAILFWIPRDLETMPGFTTNIEFGMCIAREPHKVWLGAPAWATKMDYIEHLALEHKREREYYLSELCRKVVKDLNV